MRPGALARTLRVAALVLTPPLAAMLPQVLPAQPARTAVACRGQRISRIDVVTGAARVQRTDSLEWWDVPEDRLRRTRRTTRAHVIADLLLLRPGERCDEFTRAESERVLRAHPFVADARVRAFDDGRGGVFLDVRTRDEFVPIVSASPSSDAPWLEALTLGDGNVFGSGVLLAAGYERYERRTGGEFRLHDYTVRGRPWQVVLAGRIGDVGERYFNLDLIRPLLTDAQRFTWRVSAVDETAVFAWQDATNDTTRSLGTITRHMYVGGLLRLGSVRNPLRVGLAWTREASGTRVSDYENAVDPADPRVERFRDQDFSRVSALLVHRRLRFARVPGFETLRASEDIRLGLEIDATMGFGIPALGADARDVHASFSADYGIGGERSFLALRAGQQARRLLDGGGWQDVFSSGNATLHHRRSERRVWRAELAADAAWRALRPMQLRLGRPGEGVRGYDGSREAGARRGLLRLEERRLLGTWRDWADVGLATFTDVGRVWQGDDAFGRTSAVKAGFGFGLLAAFPPGTRRTYRLDVAYPLVKDPDAGFEVRLTVQGARQLTARALARDWRNGQPRAPLASRFDMPR